MIRGFMKTTSLVTLVAATGLILGNSAYAPANAADLGGGCCADLEERVAELEATTARKGNRIVSLQIYGFVSRGILLWDVEQGDDGGGTLGPDESESKTVLIDEDGSRFGLTGSATLRPGWSAGYRIELATDGVQGSSVNIRHNHLWIESEQFGRFTIGEQAAATDGISHIVLANTYSDSGAYQNDIYTNLSAGSYRDFGGGRGDFVRYDSPSLYGFIVSASWSNDPDSSTDFIELDDDEYWDVTLRYSGEFNAFRVAAGIGYTEADGGDSEVTQGSASVMHIPTGIFLAFSTGELGLDGADDEDYWYLTGGVERVFNHRGKTTFYVEYGDYNDPDSDEMWGAGIVQSIDAAAMDVYLQYRNVEEDDGDDAISTFVLGTKINF
jgi:predicted porin